MGSNLLDSSKSYGNDRILEANVSQMALNGYYSFLTTTSIVSGEWFAILFLEDSTITTLTEPLEKGDTTIISGRTFEKGTVLYGYFTGIQRATGAFRAFNTKES